MIQRISSAAAIAALAACATPTPPSITTDDIDAAEAEFARLNMLPAATSADLPTGSVTYDGKLGGELTVDGESGYGLLGDMGLEINFLTNAISGNVTNLNLIKDGLPDQLLGGSLIISSILDPANARFAGAANGSIDAVSDDLPFRGTTSIDLGLSGSFVNDSNPAVVGTWSGGSTGGGDFDVSGSGNFYATQE